jgi:NAD(P)-dependent dehydrogenase (short-subunit alcohol dehydrogenase family)
MTHPAPALLDFTGKLVLVTGGTRGIGLEAAAAFAAKGASCALTYRWGEHDEAEIARRFASVGAPPPVILQADAANAADTKRCLEMLHRAHQKVDIFVSNVSSATIVNSFGDYTWKGLKQSLSYSSWPLVEYVRQIREVFGENPRHVVAVSSTGPDHYSAGYDFVAASKAVMEALARQLHTQLGPEGVVVHAVRSRAIRTRLFEDTFGRELAGLAEHLVPDCKDYWLELEEVASCLVALCSGYCDALAGQVITVDKGTSFFDNFMEFQKRYRERAQLP